MSKKILIMQRTAPYGSSLAREGLDYILTASAYDQNLSILFCGDGVFQLLAGQNSTNIGLKPQLAAMEILPMYDVEDLYVVSEDLAERHIKPEQLGLNVNLINRSQASELMEEQDKVIGF